MDKISIIVPVYNVEKYLDKCVNSIINQTYKNLEILLINDGSTDNSGSICDKLAKKDSRIKVIHKENEGLSLTRNLGVKLSTGDFISFIDSDDYITEDYCETLINILLKENADIATVDLSMIRENGYKIVTSDDLKEENHDKKVKVYTKKNILKEILLRKELKNYIGTKLYRRSIFDKCLFKANTNYEDILFTYQTSKLINKIAYINKDCYMYLKRENSITATCSEKNLNDFLDVVTYRYNDIKKNKSVPEKYNLYALIESIISISIKHIIAGRAYKSVEDKSDELFSIIDKALDKKGVELEVIPLLNDSQKACLALMRYNKELFYNFLEVRQSMKKKGIL